MYEHKNQSQIPMNIERFFEISSIDLPSSVKNPFSYFFFQFPKFLKIVYCALCLRLRLTWDYGRALGGLCKREIRRKPQKSPNVLVDKRDQELKLAPLVHHFLRVQPLGHWGECLRFQFPCLSIYPSVSSLTLVNIF